MAAPPRAVRIPRRRTVRVPVRSSPATPTSLPARALPPDPVPPTAPDSSEVPNLAGTQRGRRLYVGYVLAIVVVTGSLSILAWSSPYPGVSQSSVTWIGLGVGSVIVALGGLPVTLGLAPQSARIDHDRFVVRGRFGGVYRYEMDVTFRARIEKSYSAGFFSSEPTFAVLVGQGSSTPRSFLVGQSIVDLLPSDSIRRDA
ncbi:MAG: hypothetical protein L3K03_06975 [Thermoplasmata archaeon]|nr:hypothetical protein [Thermoplasmata archaeon]